MIHLVSIQLIICLLTPASHPAASHVYADNYIDRSLSIVIRDQSARIEYSVAMNDTTIRRLIKEWRSPSVFRSKDGKRLSESRIAAAPHVAGERKEKTAMNRSPENAPPAAAEEFKNDATLVAEFRKLLTEHLAKDLLVTCHDQPVTIREINPDTPPRHHMSATVQFEFTLPAKKVVDLSVVDSNFSQCDGGARYALKVGGNLVLANSNVAPILVRADRVEFAELSETAREQACKIKAQIVRTRRP